MLLLTERGISCSGFDHAPGLAITNSQVEKKVVSAREKLSALKEEDDLRQLQAELLLQRQQELEAERIEKRKRESEEAAAKARTISVVPPIPPPHSSFKASSSKLVTKPARSRLPQKPSSSSSSSSSSLPKKTFTSETDHESSTTKQSRDIWAPLVDETKSKVASLRPARDAAILAKASYPMSITGRADSIVRGQKSVFNNTDREDVAAAAASELRLQYLPRHSAARVEARKKAALIMPS
jgi:hypothetical protein